MLQQVFMYDSNVKSGSARKVRRQHQFQAVTVLNGANTRIYRTVNTLRQSEALLDKPNQNKMFIYQHSYN
jgi:hypothetical protein